MNNKGKIALIAALAIVVTAFHYSTDLHAGKIHEILQRVYYLPIILAGLWFGAPGGLLTAVLICLVYFPHAWHGWEGSFSVIFRLLEMVMFHVVGALTGVLSSRVRKALKSETLARRERESAYQSLKEKTDQLFSMEEQLRRSDRLAALGRLSASLAHEIRNPLASIKTSVEILRDQQGGEEGGEPSGGEARAVKAPPDLCRVLLEETDRLDRILTDFLDFAKEERDRPAGEEGSCRIGEELSKTVDLLAPQMEKKGVRIEYDAASFSTSVQIHGSHLRQALLNLFLNSIEALPEGGRIKVWAGENDGGTACFFVEDSGPGISAEDAPLIFDPFFSTKEGGTGLGLSIVERIISSSGGRIVLHGEQRPSSRFQITLSCFIA